MKHFVEATFAKIREIYPGSDKVEEIQMSLHDPLPIWYVLTGDRPGWKFDEDRDVRVETQGQWTRGMSIVDRRTKEKETDLTEELKEHDRGAWLHSAHGNRVRIALDSPDRATLGQKIIQQIFKC